VFNTPVGGTQGEAGLAALTSSQEITSLEGPFFATLPKCPKLFGTAGRQAFTRARATILPEHPWMMFLPCVRVFKAFMDPEPSSTNDPAWGSLIASLLE
jgi:hypothetical protein